MARWSKFGARVLATRVRAPPAALCHELSPPPRRPALPTPNLGVNADTARADLLRASARWCTRANVPHDCDGRRAALHWAMTDQPPPSSPLIALQSPTACAELRQCIQHCYALSLSRRYNKAKDAASQPRSNK